MEENKEKSKDSTQLDDSPEVKDIEALKSQLAEAKVEAEANLAGWQPAK